MKCQRCGANMVEKPPSCIYTTNPPQWDSVMWCACGHVENLGRVRGKSAEDTLMDAWRRENSTKTEDAT